MRGQLNQVPTETVLEFQAAVRGRAKDAKAWLEKLCRRLCGL
jgi:hypothetical protein